MALKALEFFAAFLAAALVLALLGKLRFGEGRVVGGDDLVLMGFGVVVVAQHRLAKAAEQTSSTMKMTMRSSMRTWLMMDAPIESMMDHA